jgi:hypothetical protein
MKTLLAAATALTLLVTVTSANATEPMSKEEIAKLPQDRVQAARRICAERWGQDYSWRVLCEDTQFKALRALIERGSI